MIKSQVGSKTKAKAQDGSSSKRASLDAAKAQLKTFASRDDAKAAVRAAVEAKNSGRADAIRASRSAASGSSATASAAASNATA
jgi:hypothetical protein